MTWPCACYLPKLTVPAENPNFLLALLYFPDCSKNIESEWEDFFFHCSFTSFYNLLVD